MAKRPVPRYDFKAFGAAIKAAREGCKESRKKVGDEMFISPRYLANIENKGQHPSLRICEGLRLRGLSLLDYRTDKIPLGTKGCTSTLPYDDCASIPCGVVVRKQHKMLFAASKFERVT